MKKAADEAKLKALNAMTYKEQGKWFLNSFWADMYESAPEKAEDMWGFVQTCELLDKRGGDGNELDEWGAHQLLEKVSDTLTVKEMREKLTEIDIDFNKMVSLAEFLIFHYGVDWKTLVNAPQAANAEAAKLIAVAAELVEKAQHSVEDSMAAEVVARAAEAEVKVAAAKAKEEQATLDREAEAHQTKMDGFRKTGENMELGIVKRNRAKNELAQLEASDPMPLQRARINQGAAVRRLAKATKKAEAATIAAETARAQAEEDLQAAVDHLKEIQAQCKGSGDGTMWWMGRELEEAKKYMSQKQLAKLAEQGK